MVLRNSLFGADIAKHIQLLLIFSAHVFSYQSVLWKQESFLVPPAFVETLRPVRWYETRKKESAATTGSQPPLLRLSDDDLRKAARLCRRLLGSANDPAEHERALQFMAALKRVDLVQELRSELKQLSESPEQSIAGAANQLLALSGENPPELISTQPEGKG